MPYLPRDGLRRDKSTTSSSSVSSIRPGSDDRTRAPRKHHCRAVLCGWPPPPLAAARGGRRERACRRASLAG
uniref:Uncharacterized protein n=1 Tax=Oryza meridionalis TaxID=40149 RepID=A0A0E0ER91_9ORYZ